MFRTVDKYLKELLKSCLAIFSPFRTDIDKVVFSSDLLIYVGHASPNEKKTNDGSVEDVLHSANDI